MSDYIPLCRDTNVVYMGHIWTLVDKELSSKRITVIPRANTNTAVWYPANPEGCQSFRTQVISYPGHFVPTLVISYLLFGHFVPSNNHFVPRSFRTHFGHFVPRSTGYEMTIWWSIRTQVISYPFWSFRTHFRHFVPSKDGWIDERTDRRVLIEMTN